MVRTTAVQCPLDDSEMALLCREACVRKNAFAGRCVLPTMPFVDGVAHVSAVQ